MSLETAKMSQRSPYSNWKPSMLINKFDLLPESASSLTTTLSNKIHSLEYLLTVLTVWCN